MAINDVGEGWVVKFNDDLFAVRTNNEIDMLTIINESKKYKPQSKRDYRVCVNGDFTLKRGFLGDISDAPQPYYVVSNFSVLFADDHLQELQIQGL